VIGKCRLPSVRVAVPTVPGVRPRLVSAAAKSASRRTAVSTPFRDGIDATGVGAAEEVAEGVDAAEPAVAVLEQAARPPRRRAAAAKLTVAFWKVRMM
jgi:hypothetical protein